jgi:hypothetical protein
MLTRTTPGLPAVVDLRVYDGPIKNQGNLGSCTGHAFSSAIEWIFRKYIGKQPVLSPLYLYAHALEADGDFPNDNGSDGTTLCGVSIVNGCCEDSLYPDASQEITEPTAEQDANAAKYQMGAFHGLAGAQVALSVLGDPVPWPVEIGFTVYPTFEGDEIAETGVMPLQAPGATPIGGHEVKFSGYDVSPAAILRPANCPPAVEGLLLDAPCRSRCGRF